MANKIIFSDYSVSIHNGRNSQSSPYLYIGVKSSGDRYRSLIHFDISSLPKHCRLESCTLNLYITASHSCSKAEFFTPYLVTSPWTAETTWENKPSVDYSVRGSSSTILKNGWVSFDITDIANSWITGDINFGLIIKTPEVLKSTLRSAAASGAPSEDIQPFLVVKYSQSVNSKSRFLSLRTKTTRRYTSAINVSSWDRYSIFLQNAGSNTITVFLETGPANPIFTTDSTIVLYPGNLKVVSPKYYSFFIRIGFLSHGGPSMLNLWIQRPI